MFLISEIICLENGGGRKTNAALLAYLFILVGLTGRTEWDSFFA